MELGRQWRGKMRQMQPNWNSRGGATFMSHVA